MLCRYVKQYAFTLKYFLYLINVFEIHKISVIIAKKTRRKTSDINFQRLNASQANVKVTLIQR